MKAKWYLCTFIFSLTLLGVFQNQISEPNQEIVVQFAHENVTEFEAENAIATVRSQLLQIGAEHIHVHEVNNGVLKISYYTQNDVASIKRIFSEEKELQLGISTYETGEKQNKFPVEHNSKYNLDVYELSSSYDFDIDMEGYVLELKSESDRYYNPYKHVFKNESNIGESKKLDRTAYIVFRNIALEINHTSHKIPEVRAGPISYKTLQLLEVKS